MCVKYLRQYQSIQLGKTFEMACCYWLIANSVHVLSTKISYGQHQVLISSAPRFHMVSTKFSYPQHQVRFSQPVGVVICLAPLIPWLGSPGDHRKEDLQPFCS